MTQTIETGRSTYLSRICQCPRLSREEEQDLARRWLEEGDSLARDRLVRAHLRHVVAIARRYRRYNCATLEELIAEGNFGLTRALDKFDPERGTRFLTYAVYWIRAYISQYLMRSSSLVTTGVGSKILSKIRQARAEIVRASGERSDVNSQIAERLALSVPKLSSLLARMEVHDVSWDASVDDTLCGSFSELPESHWLSAEAKMMSAESGQELSQAVSCVVSKLDERERYIVERRLMANPEEMLTLAEIGRQFGVSRERTRQLEARAMRKIKAALTRSSLGRDWLAKPRAA
jgi:RNA polymerase sigma-32 factor